MDVGVFLPLEPAGQSPQGLYREVVDIGRSAEDLGYHSLWCASRHLSPDYASVPAPMVLLAAVAEATDRLVLGTSVVSLPLEHPVRLAERFATLDALSGGRARLGAGSGDDPPAFEAMAADFDSRREETSRRLPLLLAALEGEPLAGGLKLHPEVAEPRRKVGLGVQSAGGAAWAGSQKVMLLQGRSEPGRPDPTESQRAAAEAYRAEHPTGRVVTSRNVWVGDLDDPLLAEAVARYDTYLRSRGREALPEGLESAVERMNILSGEPEEAARRVVENVAPISPDELLVTVDPGGLPAGEVQKRLAALAPALLGQGI